MDYKTAWIICSVLYTVVFAIMAYKMGRLNWMLLVTVAVMSFFAWPLFLTLSCISYVQHLGSKLRKARQERKVQ